MITTLVRIRSFNNCVVSDGERVKGVKSPTPKGAQSQEHTFVKDDVHVENTDQYIDDMQKGTSNILVGLTFLFDVLCMDTYH